MAGNDKVGYQIYKKDRLKALQYRLELDDNGKEIPVQISDEGLANMSILQGIVDTVVNQVLFWLVNLLGSSLFIYLFTIVTCIIELVFKNSI